MPTEPLRITDASRPLLDEPLAIQLYGFAPGERVTVRASMRDDLDRRWSSAATFVADEAGHVDLATQAPIAGDYTGVDARGLCWSMTLPPDAAEVSPFVISSTKPRHLQLSTEREGTRISISTPRQIVAPGVGVTPLREAGLVGTLYQPESAQEIPAVLVLGGSSGTARETQAALLAAHGYAALALAYFGAEGLPPALEGIPVEYVLSAVEWLLARPGVRAEGVAALGHSRGAELALLLGSLSPRVTAVLAYAPSSVVWGAVGYDAPAWTWRGTLLPRMRNRVSEEESAQIFAAEPYAAAPWYRRNLADTAARAEAAIAVERIAGPVLLISGEDDQLWPASEMGEQIMARLATHQHPYPYQHFHYPGAGHLIDVPGLPTAVAVRRNRALDVSFAYGGTPQGSARAAVDSWRAVLAFLAAWRHSPA
jgi:dienelactone hydrolase